MAKSSKLRVAFQGELGAFSHMAIRQLLGPRVQAVPCAVFDAMFRAVADGRAAAAMVPIENTLHGSVYENYDLLLKYEIPILAETGVRIVHNLIAPPGVRFPDIKQAYSHPVALNQCLDFFAAHPRIEKAPYYDTAGSVKMLSEQRPAGAAAIASSLAAELYGCRILKKSIEDDRRNFTRFFLIGKQPVPGISASRGYKTSLVFTTRNVPGSLFRAISAFALRDISLLKIQSRPLRGKPWEYLFYVDALARATDPKMQNALHQLQEFADFFRLLGTYPRG